VKTTKHNRTIAGKHRSGYRKAVLPALVAVGGGLASAPAAALELGPIVVHSHIGQPLRASVAYALAPDEIIDTYCVSVRSGGIDRDIPGLRRPSVRIADGKITITGRNPVMEPMISANLTVKCPYTPNVVRNYMIFLDPAGTVPEKMEATAAASVATAPTVTAVPTAAAPADRVAPLDRSPIEQGSQYRVQPGDSLSGIVMRLAGRAADLQSAMDAVFVANPDAFINGDPNLIQAGSLILIPEASGFVAQQDTSTAALDTRANEPADKFSDDSLADSSVYQGAESLAAPPAEERVPAEYDFDYGAYEEAPETTADSNFEDTTLASDEAAAEEPAGAYNDLVAGDLVPEEPVAEQPAETGVTEAAAEAAPVQPRTIKTPEPAAEASSWNWLIWIAAGALAIFGGVLLIGPRLRERFGSKPVGGADAATSPVSEHAAPSAPAFSSLEPTMAVEEITPVQPDVDFDLSDDSPTEENLTLDADLIAGTGFAEADAGDVQVNQDFGFAATTELDLELTEQASQEIDAPETDIIPPPDRPPEDLIVEEAEAADDTEYDMSVIVDATKMPDPLEVTERDLRAVPLDDTGQTPIADAYTIEQGADLETLEQDYEDEMTKTLALNKEIEEAAADLAGRMDDTIEARDDTSVEVQLANLSDLDLTSTLEAQNDDLDVTARMETEDETVEMPSKGKSGA
jgi:hypothetical protein